MSEYYRIMPPSLHSMACFQISLVSEVGNSFWREFSLWIFALESRAPIVRTEGLGIKILARSILVVNFPGEFFMKFGLMLYSLVRQWLSVKTPDWHTDGSTGQWLKYDSHKISCSLGRQPKTEKSNCQRKRTKTRKWLLSAHYVSRHGKK